MRFPSAWLRVLVAGTAVAAFAYQATPLIDAAKAGNLGQVKTLLQAADPNGLDAGAAPRSCIPSDSATSTS